MRTKLSTAQRRIIDSEGVTLEGWDAKGRPVVSMMAGIPAQLRRWAVLKNGDPTDITEPITHYEWM